MAAAQVKPTLHYPLSDDAKRHYGISSPNKTGVWELFQEIKVVDDVAPRKIRKKKKDDPSARIVFSLIIIHENAPMFHQEIIAFGKRPEVVDVEDKQMEASDYDDELT